MDSKKSVKTPPNGTRAVASAHEFPVDRLQAYMAQHVAGFPKDAQLEVFQFAHGQSNPTFYVQAKDKKYVMRKKPPGVLLASAHAIEREYRIMTALQGSRVPVPRTYCLCTDSSVIGTPFYVMAFVEGRIFKDPTLPGLSKDEKFAVYHAMAQVLAELHLTDFERIGLGDYGKRDAFVQRQVSIWDRQYSASKTREITAMNKLREYLTKNIPTGDEAKQVTLVHGDFRLDNVIFHPTQPRVVAVLDWELSTLGHPISDLAYNCMHYYIPPNNLVFSGLLGLNLQEIGVLSEREYVTLYHRLAKRKGPVQNFNYFVALSFFRMAAIGQGVYKRSLQGNASSENAKVFERVTEDVAEVGWRVASNQITKQSSKTSNAEKIQLAELQPFQFSPRFYELRRKVLDFMDEHIYPNEHLFFEQHKELTAKHGHPWVVPPIIEDLKRKAKAAGLWNLFLAKHKHHQLGPGLTNLEYAPLCEIMGRVLHIAPEAFNCSAPDTGNMEVLTLYGTPEQQKKWLEPLMAGEIRSCYGMTEPLVASSDATNIECRIERDGDSYVINGRKWWTSGAQDPRCKVCILMGKTDPTAPTHLQQSMIIVPMDIPGVRIVRHLSVFGYDDAPHGHSEVEFANVRVPAGNLLLGEGRGFEIAQGRLGPGRIHHCMRLIGIAERGLELMCERAKSRTAFRTLNSQKGTMLAEIAEARIKLSQARLLTLQAAAMMDTVGNKAARQHIAMIKVVAPRMALSVLDSAIQAFGGMGVCQDTPLAMWWAQARTLRLADGPDEVHLGTVAQVELGRSKL